MKISGLKCPLTFRVRHWGSFPTKVEATKLTKIKPFRWATKQKIKIKDIDFGQSNQTSNFCQIPNLRIYTRTWAQSSYKLLLGSYYTYWSYYLYCSDFWWIVLFIFITALLYPISVRFIQVNPLLSNKSVTESGPLCITDLFQNKSVAYNP